MTIRFARTLTAVTAAATLIAVVVGAVTQGEQDLRPHPGEHQQAENDDPGRAGDDDQPGQPVQAVQREPARVVLVGPQAITAEGEAFRRRPA